MSDRIKSFLACVSCVALLGAFAFVCVIEVGMAATVDQYATSTQTAAPTNVATFTSNERVQRFYVECSTLGDNEVVAAITTKQIRVLSLSVLATSTTSVDFYIKNDTDGGILGGSSALLTVDKDGGDGPAGYNFDWNPGGICETGTDGEALEINLSAATTVIVRGTYIQVD